MAPKPRVKTEKKSSEKKENRGRQKRQKKQSPLKPLFEDGQSFGAEDLDLENPKRPKLIHTDPSTL